MPQFFFFCFAFPVDEHLGNVLVFSVSTSALGEMLNVYPCKGFSGLEVFKIFTQALRERHVHDDLHTYLTGTKV